MDRAITRWATRGRVSLIIRRNAGSDLAFAIGPVTGSEATLLIGAKSSTATTEEWWRGNCLIRHKEAEQPGDAIRPSAFTGID